MAVYRIFPKNDTFISTENVLGNAGKDEIVEIGGYPNISDVGQTNRILVKYDTSEIQNTINNLIVTRSYTANIKLYLADASEIPADYTLYSYPISGTWDNGIGKFGDVPTNDTGVSWKYRQAGQSNAWLTGSYPTGVTGSYTSTLQGGGNWYTASLGFNMEFTQSHALNSSNDVDIDVTKAISLIGSGTLGNDGFIVKLQDSLEFNTTSSIQLKYYSADTNTTYPPFLEFNWDDSSYVTGSLSVLSNSTAIINLTNNKGKYVDNGKQRFRVSARPKYPVRTFTTSSAYLTNYALPSGSYWGLRDENTEEMVVDFNTGSTKISCDSQGAFFDVYMDGLQPERYYRILVKTTLDGSTTVIDNQNIFKVVRNG
jgi:hypothetical protein